MSGLYRVFVRYGDARRYTTYADLPYDEAAALVFELRRDLAVNWAYMSEEPVKES